MAEEAERFGGRLRERRLELGLTQREVAERVEGKTEGKDISRYERAEHIPGQDTRVALAHALETDIGDLYAGPVAEREESGPTPDPFTAPDSARLTQIEEQLAQVQTDLAWLVAREKAAAALAEAQEQTPGRTLPPDRHRGETGS